MASTGIKGYYRQKKSGVGKSSAKSKSKPKSSTKKSSKATASFGSDCAQPSYLDLQGDYDETENLLRQFDVNMAYGPCIGMSRLARWERANSLGLNPPKEVGDFLRGGKVGIECLWDGLV